MGLTTLTEMEERWMKRARAAVSRGEDWKACNECRSYHPADRDEACDDPAHTLPGDPAELLAQ